MTKKIDELRAQREEALESAKAITAKAKEESRDLTEDEVTAIKKHVDESKRLGVEADEEEAKERDRLNTQALLDAELEDASRVSDPIFRPDPSPRREPAKAKKPEFAGFGDFLGRVREASRTPGVGGDLERRIQASSGLQTAVDSEGGFLIPPTYASEILSKMYERGALLSRCRRFTVSGNELKIPYVNESSRADGSRWGGVRGYWKEEGGTPTATKPDFGQLSLRLKKAMAVCYVTDEQLDDAPATGSVLQEAVTDEMLFTVENAIYQGDGAGRPLGILNAPCTVEVTKETNQTAATVWGPNVVKMHARLYPRSLDNAVWFVNQSTIPFLWSLTLEGRFGSASTAAEGVPIFFPAGSVMGNGRYGTLMGMPVIPVEYTKAVGTAGDIMLADMSQYVLIEKGGVDMASSMHVRFLYAEQTFRFTYRVDGSPWWAAALTPYDAGSTLSPFVRLGARS